MEERKIRRIRTEEQLASVRYMRNVDAIDINIKDKGIHLEISKEFNEMIGADVFVLKGGENLDIVLLKSEGFINPLYKANQYVNDPAKLEKAIETLTKHKKGETQTTTRKNKFITVLVVGALVVAVVVALSFLS